MTQTNLCTVILAAGQGKRMFSDTPKVLHHVAGKALLEHVVAVASPLDHSTPPVVVFGHEGAKVKHTLAHLNVNWIEQKEQLGTGHALQQALPAIPAESRVLVLYGDVPFISLESLKKLVTETPVNAIGMITAYFPDPTGLGRIIRDENQNITSIIEEKDADKQQREIQEINSGIYLVPAKLLKDWLPQLKNQNAQKEYYLTDIIALATQNKIPVHSTEPATYEEVLGINDRAQLAKLERCFQSRIANKLMLQGVTLRDPARLDVRGEISVGRDTSIDINVILEGHVKIGNHCVIGPNCVIRNTIIGDRVEVKANSVLDGAEIAEDCVVGPFARLRPGAMLAQNSHIGNFVEIKNSEIGKGSKVNHLSYVGDSEVGKNVNIGAGTITCNYDGVNKNRTIIGDNAFIGSNTALVAPITINHGATIGAGSTITRDAPPEQLTVSRASQKSIANWQRPQKKEV